MVVPESLRWLLKEGFQETSAGLQLPISGSPKHEGIFIYFKKKIETYTQSAFYSQGSRTRTDKPVNFTKCIQRAGITAVGWKHEHGRYVRIRERNRYSCRADSRITRAPRVKINRGTDLPNKTIKAGCGAFIQCYVFDVLDKKYNGYTQAELKDIGNDVLALHADEMYGILFSYHHSSHQPCGHLQKPTENPKVIEILKDNVEKCTNFWRLRSIFVNEMVVHLESIGFPVNMDNRLWFPTVADIRNIVKVKGLERDRLEAIIEDLRNDGNLVHYVDEPDKDNPRKSKLLLVYQNSIQQEILKNFGTTIFLDSTHKTNQYNLPLFLLGCWTPHGYQVVGFFITCAEHPNGEDIITEALSIIKSWNEGLSPRYSMTDMDQAEINAIQAVFPEIRPFWCDFHVKQAWDKRIKNIFKHSNLDTSIPLHEDYKEDRAKAEAFECLQHLMYCETPNIHLRDQAIDQDFNSRLMEVVNRDICLRSPAFRNYVLYYAENKERWAMPFRNLEALSGIRTNNGIEALNNVLKRRVLSGIPAHRSLPQLLTSLVFDFIPNKLQTYRHQMMSDSSSYKRIVSQNHELPSYLNGIPSKNLVLVKESYFRSFSIQKENIRQIGEGQFVVRSTVGDSSGNYFAYKVSLHNEVRCDCVQFRGTPCLPCKHVLAIVRLSYLKWDDLPAEFRLGPNLSVECTLGKEHSVPETNMMVEINDVNEEIGSIDEEPPVSDEVPGPSTRSDTDLNRSLSILSDLKTQMFRVPEGKRGELLALMEKTVRDQLISQVGDLCMDEDELAKTKKRSREDFKATLPAPSKKTKKMFPKYNKSCSWSDSADSDFE